MYVGIKFCGLTRVEDAATAIALGSDFLGVIFAGGPRNRTPEQAAEILRAADHGRRVGVFGSPHAAELRAYMTAVPLSVAQLHGDASPKAVMAARAIGADEVWAVLPVVDGVLGEHAAELFQCADAVVLDTRAANGLGGTGRSFDWEAVAQSLDGVERRARLVLAGGLNPDNVARAVQTLHPDIVDVSSGVESAPGVKDPILMRRFVEAVRSA
jgi:phosphoribosylanthranilate isomerase